MKTRISIFALAAILCSAALVPIKTCADDRRLDGYFWEILSPKEKFVYVLAYVEGISEMNLEWRHQMDVLMALYDLEKNEKNKHLAEYAKQEKAFYEKSHHFFGIRYRQLVEGTDQIYKDYKNKSIELRDAFSLVRADLDGTDKKELERRMIYMRKSKEERERIILEDLINKTP